MDKNTNETIYPFKKEEQGVDMGKEIDVLRQAVYELKEQNINLSNRIKKLEAIK